MTEQAEQRRLRRDISWGLIPVALLAGVGLGTHFLIGALWGPDALGWFNLVTIAMFTFAVLGACGLQYAVLRAIAEAPDDRDRVAAVVVGALVPSTVLAGSATALFLAARAPIAGWQGEHVAHGMLWAAPGLFCFAINKVLLGVVNGLRRMRAFAIYTALRYGLIAVGLGVAWGLGLTGEQLPVIWTLAEGTLLVVLTFELVATVALARGLASRGPDGWPAWARRHLDFGARGVLATLAYEVNSKLDVWMLGIAAPGAPVGIYSLAGALNDGAQQLAVVVQNNVNPVIAHALAEDRGDQVSALVRRTRRWFVPALAAACAAGAALYPHLVPWVIGNPAYARAAWPFAIMMLGLALASPYLPFTQVLLMAARPGWHTVYVVAVVAVNLIANLALIPVLGLEGAATAAALSVIASAVLVRALVRWRVGLRL